MERLKFSLHFSYFILLFVSVVMANVWLFVMCSLAMLVHELAHYFVAKKLFYHCTKLQISAFGAVLYGKFDDATPSHQVYIAIAGPLANLIVVVVCVALWWYQPESYYYTEPLVESNLAMALVNLLPVYPLDGGRVLWALCGNHQGAIKWLKRATLALSLLLFGAFLLTFALGQAFFGMGLFALCLCASYCVESNGSHYCRTNLSELVSRRLPMGIEKKTLVFSSNASLSRVITKLNGHFMYTIEVQENDQTIGVINQQQLTKLLVKCDGSSTLGEIISKSYTVK